MASNVYMRGMMPGAKAQFPVLLLYRHILKVRRTHADACRSPSAVDEAKQPRRRTRRLRERESCGGGGQAASTFPSMNRDGIIQEIKHEFRAARHVTDEAEVRRLDVTRSCNPPLMRLLRSTGSLHQAPDPPRSEATKPKP